MLTSAAICQPQDLAPALAAPHNPLTYMGGWKVLNIPNSLRTSEHSRGPSTSKGRGCVITFKDGAKAALRSEPVEEETRDPFLPQDILPVHPLVYTYDNIIQHTNI